MYKVFFPFPSFFEPKVFETWEQVVEYIIICDCDYDPFNAHMSDECDKYHKGDSECIDVYCCYSLSAHDSALEQAKKIKKELSREVDGVIKFTETYLVEKVKKYEVYHDTYSEEFSTWEQVVEYIIELECGYDPRIAHKTGTCPPPGLERKSRYIDIYCASTEKAYDEMLVKAKEIENLLAPLESKVECGRVEVKIFSSVYKIEKLSKEDSE
jgi:hypothetical protein